MTHETAAHLLHRMRLRAERRALWMEILWRQDRSSPDQGLAITAGQVARILQPLAQRAAEEHSFTEIPEIQALQQRIEQADHALAADPSWQSLCQNFNLSQSEADLLCLALAEAMDPEFGRVIAYLHDDTRQTKATPWLAARLGSESPFAPPEALLRWHLATPTDLIQPVLPATPFQADPALLNYVLHGVWNDAQLHGIATLHQPAPSDLPLLYPAALAALQNAAGTGILRADLLGQTGSGRLTLARQFAAAQNLPLLAVDCEKLQAPRDKTLATAAVRMARATGAILLWHGAEKYSADLPAAILEGIATLRAVPPDAITRPDATVIALGKPSAALRRAVWQHFSADPPPALLASQRLTPAEIALVAAAAPAGDTAIRLALRRTAPPDGEILARLDCPYEWDDLVLPPEIAAQLQEFAAQIRLRWDVYENWGFGRLAHLGEGIAALFAGPSGTGKTMAAQVLARALDLDLYRVDLAGVINKYIGETEKRLRDVFAFGERAGAVLFFDEADALFGSRMAVKDSHDRFANIEIDYLLQRIERFDGIAILATNRKSDIDTAFLRRLRFVVDFVPPAPAQRRVIWRKSLPAAAPDGTQLLDRIDFDLLAEQLTLTGADIKSAALSAAFLARAEGSRIAMRHLLAAVQRELAKRGQVMRLRPAEAAAQ
jgi:hypothetical protein